jgi:hypothetical protein
LKIYSHPQYLDKLEPVRLADVFVVEVVVAARQVVHAAEPGEFRTGNGWNHRLK